MTIDEAREFLTDISYKLGNMSVEYLTEKDGEKMRDAISVLEQEPCDDVIDRQALRAQFDHLNDVYEGMSEEEKHEAYIYGGIIWAIDNAPPIIPKQKTGKWVKYVAPRCGEQHYKCTNCDDYVNFGQYGDYYTKDFKFCPHCGAKMEGSESND